MLTEHQYGDAAKLIACDVPSVKAVAQVEANGNGFLKDGRPKILFEGHVFWKQLLKNGIDPQSIQVGNEDILYPVWDPAKVRKYYNMDQYARLEKAKQINEDAALKSASWGAFQIMGFNYAACGYNSVQNFVDAQSDDYNQLLSFCNYIKKVHLNVNLQHQDWKGFARGYNGPDYWKNQYDIKLKNAYDGFKNQII
ncbi:MAG: hypothetical protein BGO69_01805 [Bacteroidetes bacterium 46-16]|nr:MAG: hypothetical protein BGO69_01805 [Bacteroidetes bacterium 46-16]